jgi:hypothetical protein
MEENRRTREPTLHRSCERNRLEDQLWTMAYELVWPVIRRSVRGSIQERPYEQKLDVQELVARGA